MWIRKRTAAWLVAAVIITLVASGQTSHGISTRLIERRLCLADLRNQWYRIVFPKAADRARYSGQSEYLFSIASPNGRSLFAIRRGFSARGNFRDTLVKRELTPSGTGPEQVLPVPFIVLFQFAVSPNERFMVIAGRLQDPTLEKDKRDGIFVLDRSTNAVHPIAPYASLGQDVRSLNVGDRGEVVIYEEKGVVLTFTGSNGELAQTGHHPGILPALMPDGRGYIYAHGSQLFLNTGGSRRELLSVRNVVGAIRVSPDSAFIAFGIDHFGDLSSTQLRICELKTLDCVDGPKYWEWVAGRETFWIQQ